MRISKIKYAIPLILVVIFFATIFILVYTLRTSVGIKLVVSGGQFRGVNIVHLKKEKNIRIDEGQISNILRTHKVLSKYEDNTVVYAVLSPFNSLNIMKEESYNLWTKDWFVVVDNEVSDFLDLSEYLDYLILNAYVLDEEDFYLYMETLESKLTDTPSNLERDLSDEEVQNMLLSKDKLSYDEVYVLDKYLSCKHFKEGTGWEDSIFDLLETVFSIDKENSIDE